MQRKIDVLSPCTYNTDSSIRHDLPILAYSTAFVMYDHVSKFSIVHRFLEKSLLELVSRFVSHSQFYDLLRKRS